MAYEQLKLDNQLCFRLYTAARLITATYTPYFKQLGITYLQYLVLMILWEKDNVVIGDITVRLQLETNTVTPLLQRMEKQGLITRSKGIKDSRQRVISLTEKGKELEDAVKEVPLKIAREISKEIGTEDLSSLVSLLDRFIYVLK